MIKTVMYSNCFRLYRFYFNKIITINTENISLESYENYNIKICKCGKEDVEAFELDNDIASAISKLNKKGFYTLYCCSGHKDGSIEGYILFKNKDILDYLYLLPISWDIDLEWLKHIGSVKIISDKYEQNKDEYLNDLSEFVNNLPDISKKK